MAYVACWAVSSAQRGGTCMPTTGGGRHPTEVDGPAAGQHAGTFVAQAGAHMGNTLVTDARCLATDPTSVEWRWRLGAHRR